MAEIPVIDEIDFSRHPCVLKGHHHQSPGLLVLPAGAAGNDGHPKIQRDQFLDSRQIVQLHHYVKIPDGVRVIEQIAVKLDPCPCPGGA